MKILKETIGMCSDVHWGIHMASPQWHKIALDYAYWLKQELLNPRAKNYQP